MKHLFTLLFLTGLIFQLQAQNEKFKIEGTLLDSISQKPVEFAAVGLWQNNKPIDGTLTDEKGRFKFSEKTAGTYKLMVSFIGYKPMSIENVQVKENLQLGTIKLTGDTKVLDEVTITGQAALVEDKIDKLVYNADKDISNRSGSAEDVLRKVPMLAVDLDGNVSLRGSQNIKVLIDNKPSSIFAASIADAIKQIPADQIKSIEVITSPGAKYDGEGTAGIINIITKKNSLAGINGSVSVGVGYMGSNGFGNLNLRDKKWGLSFQGGGRWSYNTLTDGLNTRTSYVNNIPTYLTQTDNNSAWRNHANYSVSFDYDLSKKSSLTLAYRNRSGNNRSLGTQHTLLQDANRATIREFERYIDNDRTNYTNSVDLTYIKLFDKPDQELSFLAQWSENNRDENYTAEQNEAPYEKSLNTGLDREITIQGDYTHPLTKKIKWEVGGKGILRTVTSLGSFSYYDANLKAYAPFPARDNYLNYSQDVVSGYSSFDFNLPKKFGFQIGARYEQTLIDATFKEVANADIPNYTTILPNIKLTKAFGKSKATRLRLSYSQRIQRPSIRYLNPYIDYSNSNDISFGNPYINPEMVDQYELTYSTFFKANSINVSLFHRGTDNSITSVRYIERINEQDITKTTYANIGIDKSYGLNTSLQLQPTPKLRIGGGFDALYVYLDNKVITNTGWNFSYRANAAYNFSKGWGMQFFGFMRSPSIELQGKRGAFNFYSLAAKKDLKNKKGSFGIGIENPFTKAMVVRSYFEDTQNPAFSFSNENVRNIYRRSVRVDFQYRFGKMDANGNGLFNKKKNISNDDIKGSSDKSNEPNS